MKTQTQRENTDDITAARERLVAVMHHITLKPFFYQTASSGLQIQTLCPSCLGGRTVDPHGCPLSWLSCMYLS